MYGVSTTTGKADAALDQRLSDELDQRGAGIGAGLLAAFESEAVDRGCTHVFVTSFTFQAPGFYKRLGYEEISRWESVPTAGRDDVHMRKQL